ncbi:transposase [Streptomyces sp. NPDC056086]|uniref:transposase n=1 Tax=Streptomyces sp. NPDC056086 TaxID=3345709 RepID=UPI0035DE8483
MGGTRWRTRTGAPWRNRPKRSGPWDRVYDLFRRWQHEGPGRLRAPSGLSHG